MLKRINVAEALGAVCVLLLGVTVIFIGQTYPIGTLGRMGPGYFPVALGGLLFVLGLTLLAETWRAPRDDQASLPFRPIIMVAAGLIAFALLVEDAGLVPAICALVVLSSLSESPIRPITVLVIATVMSAMGAFVFIKLLGMPLSAFGG